MTTAKWARLLRMNPMAVIFLRLFPFCLILEPFKNFSDFSMTMNFFLVWENFAQVFSKLKFFSDYHFFQHYVKVVRYFAVIFFELEIEFGLFKKNFAFLARIFATSSTKAILKTCDGPKAYQSRN